MPIATMLRWAVTGTCTITMPAPSSAPATVPTLNPAWKRGMIERPMRRSTSAACTFIATSQAPAAKPNANRPDDDREADRVADGDHRERALEISAIAETVRREPMRSMIVPASGSESSEPDAIASSTNPSVPGLRCR